MVKYITVLFVLILTAAECWAVQPYEPVHPDPVLEPWRWSSFPELSGLGLSCVVEAQNGTIWFGVDDGVRSYDGIHWKTYTQKDGIAGAPVNALFTAHDGSIYATTDIGISKFQGDKWSRVFPADDNLLWYIDDLLETSDGSLWAATMWGVLQIRPEGTTIYTIPEKAKVLESLAPYLSISLIPDHAILKYPTRKIWGIGVRTLGGIGLGGRRVNNTKTIWDIAPGGPGEKAGLKAGDRIISIDGGPPRTVISETNKAITLRIMRPASHSSFEVTLDRVEEDMTF